VEHHDIRLSYQYIGTTFNVSGVLIQDQLTQHVTHRLPGLRRKPCARHWRVIYLDVLGHLLICEGAGLGLVTALAARADTVVFAGARDPSNATELRELADKQENVHVLKLVSCDEEGNRAAVDEIKRIAGVLHVVIANVGGPDGVELRSAELMPYQESVIIWPRHLTSHRG
jgi:hypothetical protein